MHRLYAPFKELEHPQILVFQEVLGSKGFPDSSVGKESVCNAGDLSSIPGLGIFPWRREKLPTPVFLPGEFHGLTRGVTKSWT